MLKILRSGISYNKILPREKILLHVYPESRFQLFLDHAKNWFPPLLALDILGGYIYFNETRLLVSFVLTAIVLCLSILFAYYYMGQCALATLNESQSKLYARLCLENQHHVEKKANKLMLAIEMATALKLGNREFLDLV